MSNGQTCCPSELGGTFCCKLFLNIGSAWGQSCILCFPMASELHSASLQWRIERAATGCVGNGTCQEWVADCKLQGISTTTEERCKEISLSKLMPSTSLVTMTQAALLDQLGVAFAASETCHPWVIFGPGKLHSAFLCWRLEHAATGCVGELNLSRTSCRLQAWTHRHHNKKKMLRRRSPCQSSCLPNLSGSARCPSCCQAS